MGDPQTYSTKQGEKKMGYYVNPPAGTKEAFLALNGVCAPPNLKFGDVPKGQLPVVLIDNGYFTAAGIAYNEREFLAFTDPADSRPRVIFLMEIEKLVKVSDQYFADYAVKMGWVTPENVTIPA